tara:strand:- start:1400 stop:1648 length:249 start_codon:yes stop_codon:yes gene_type:complete
MNEELLQEVMVTVFWSFFLFHLIFHYILERELFNKNGKTSHGYSDHIFGRQAAMSFGWTIIYSLGVGFFYMIINLIGFCLGF